MQEQHNSNTTKKKSTQLISVVESGSTSPVQFDKCLTSNEIDALIQTINKALINLDLKSIHNLIDHPHIHEVGEYSFFEEIIESITEAKNDDVISLSVCDGFCHNCLPNTPVKMFRDNERTYAALYYHIKPDEPIELHPCSYCDKEKLKGVHDDISFATQFHSHKDRDPELLNLSVKFAKAILHLSLIHISEPTRPY